MASMFVPTQPAAARTDTLLVVDDTPENLAVLSEPRNRS
jgi:hypothetical protein